MFSLGFEFCGQLGVYLNVFAIRPGCGSDARFREPVGRNLLGISRKQGNKSNPHSFSVNRKIRAFINGLRVISDVHQM